MAKKTISIGFSVHIEDDKDILEILEAHKDNKSEFIRNAIRYYAGLLSKEDSNKVDKSLLRVIQLEKRLAELEKRDEERYQEILELIQKKFEESRKEREELRKELELIKKAQESLRAKAEEEKRRKEEEERERKKEIYREAVREQVIRYYDGFVEKRINDPKYRKDWVESAITRMQWFHLNDEPVDYDLLLEVLREECPELVKHFEVVLNV